MRSTVERRLSSTAAQSRSSASARPDTTAPAVSIAPNVRPTAKRGHCGGPRWTGPLIDGLGCYAVASRVYCGTRLLADSRKRTESQSHRARSAQRRPIGSAEAPRNSAASARSVAPVRSPLIAVLCSARSALTCACRTHFVASLVTAASHCCVALLRRTATVLLTVESVLSDTRKRPHARLRRLSPQRADGAVALSSAFEAGLAHMWLPLFKRRLERLVDVLPQ